MASEIVKSQSAALHIQHRIRYGSRIHCVRALVHCPCTSFAPNTPISIKSVHWFGTNPCGGATRCSIQSCVLKPRPAIPCIETLVTCRRLVSLHMAFPRSNNFHLRCWKLTEASYRPVEVFSMQLSGAISLFSPWETPMVALGLGRSNPTLLQTGCGD